MPKQYHSLLINYGPPDAPEWGIHFGDYDLAVVKQERVDLAEGFDPVPRSRSLIITTAPDQASIDAEVARRNQRRAA
jgi:hypothetical protein